MRFETKSERASEQAITEKPGAKLKRQANRTEAAEAKVASRLKCATRNK